MATEKRSVLFVCLGNTCRSTMAEGIFRHLVKQKGLQNEWIVDSAGIANWHKGKPPDEFTMLQLQRNSISGYQHTARQITMEDFRHFQFILCMDRWNLQSLEQLQPQESTAHIDLLGEYELSSLAKEIPDPYMAEIQVFEEVFAKCFHCCERFLNAQYPKQSSSKDQA